MHTNQHTNIHKYIPMMLMQLVHTSDVVVSSLAKKAVLVGVCA